MAVLRGAVVSGWGAALPEEELLNAELAANLGVTEDWIEERTGIQSRRIASKEQTSASLATDAARAALDDARIAADDIDMVVVATSTPDHQIPAAAPLVQAALGASAAGAFDVGAGCSGFLYALAQATALVTSGSSTRVLVCGADVLSRVTDYADRGTAILFGDGAGAAVVAADDERSDLGPFILRSDGSRPELLLIPEGDDAIRMNGREVYRRAVEEMSASVRAILERVEISVDDIDLLVAHQANRRILEAVGERLGLPSDRVALNIARYGNTSAASIPLAIADARAEGKLHAGDTVVMTAFGAGFVWGAGVMRWNHG